MDNAGDITAQRQKNVQPEMQAEPHLKKDAHGREDDGDQNTNDVHGESFQVNQNWTINVSGARLVSM